MRTTVRYVAAVPDPSYGAAREPEVDELGVPPADVDEDWRVQHRGTAKASRTAPVIGKREIVDVRDRHRVVSFLREMAAELYSVPIGSIGIGRGRVGVE